jgi:hypothetical protein
MGNKFVVIKVDRDCDGVCDVGGILLVGPKDPHTGEQLYQLLDSGTCEDVDDFLKHIGKAI